MQRTIHNPVLRDSVTFLRTSAETSGECTEVEAVVMPGGGNPPHFHKHYEETFTMEEGELVLDLPHGVRTILKAGDVYTVRPGEAHSFLNTTDRQARVRMLTQPGNPGFEDSIRILYGLASDGVYSKRRTPRSISLYAWRSVTPTCLANRLYSTWLFDSSLPGQSGAASRTDCVEDTASEQALPVPTIQALTPFFDRVPVIPETGSSNDRAT